MHYILCIVDIGKDIILDSVFCDMHAIIVLREMEVFSGVLVKKEVLANED